MALTRSLRTFTTTIVYCSCTENIRNGAGLLQKAALWPYGLWPYGFVALGFLLLLLITQRHYSHPGSTGSMQAAKVKKLLIDCIL